MKEKDFIRKNVIRIVKCEKIFLFFLKTIKKYLKRLFEQLRFGARHELTYSKYM